MKKSKRELERELEELEGRKEDDPGTLAEYMRRLQEEDNDTEEEG